eukprot:TRINITY_DN4403_c0_g1_i1.p1 TRINITY_DN4403_c0_g1~~TRINITY_DN4403_c0_g1_i1.p1  ORF type:complete len:281 (-),score=23.83 TRINITY_DN4403_c0_g1_i1:369-1211(-)
MSCRARLLVCTEKMAPFMRQIGRAFSISFISGLSLWGYFTLVINVCAQKIADGQPIYGFVVLIATLLLLLQQICFGRACLGNPGTVDVLPGSSGAYTAQATRDNDSDTETRMDEDGRILEGSFCLKCNTQRPPRAHHCSVCGRCVRRFDHHCPTIGNCIGEGNYKFFLLFLFYTVLFCAFVFGTLGPQTTMMRGELSGGSMVIAVICLVVCVTQPFFLGFHVYLAARDQTTLDWIAARNRGEQVHCSMDNLRFVLGRRKLMWLVPLHDHMNSLSAPILDA